MKGIEDLNRVIHLLSWWLTTIKSHNAIGFYDINKIAEGAAVKLLNEIYGFNLEILENKQKDFPSIDLGDDINKIGFQVSTRRDSRKFYDCLTKFVKGPHRTYTNGIHFLILSEGKKPKLDKEKCKDIYSEFEPEQHIITANDLLKEIKKIFHNERKRFYRIKKIVEKEFSSKLFEEDEKDNSLKREVCKIFDLMGFEFEPSSICTDNENDFFIIKKKKIIGPKNEYYLCSVCRNGNNADEIDVVTRINNSRQYLESVLLNSNEARYCEAIIISHKSFTPQAKKVANSRNVLLYTYDQLLSDLMDFRKYLTKVRTDFSLNLNGDQYIEQDFWYEKEKERTNSFDFVNQWLESSENKTLLILGDSGTGKTAFVRKLAYNLAEYYEKNPEKAIIPYFVDLKSDGQINNFLSFLYNHLRKNEVEPANTNRFLELLSNGKILLIFDAFDVMINKLGDQIIHEFICQLNQNLKGEAKVIFTAATSSFRNNQEVEWFFGMQMTNSIFGKYESHYLDIFENPACEIVYLKRFSIPQIKAYLNKNMRDNWKQFYQIIQERYDFIELASCPMFIKILIKEFFKTSGKGKSKAEIDMYGLICLWLEKEKTKGFILSGEIGPIVEDLAYMLWNKRKKCIQYKELFKFIMSYLGKNELLDIKLNIADAEVRTSGFLVRDEKDNYSFDHKSLQEFLIAQKICREFDRLNFDILDMQLPSEGTIYFLQQMIDESIILRKVKTILNETNSGKTFDNALYIYYLIQRKRILGLYISSIKYVEISDDKIEEFWKTVKADIPGEINMRDIYLKKWKDVSPIKRRKN